MAARQNIPAQLRLKQIQIQSLKGISNCTINFPADKKVTAIMGMNGSGKSTIIHALACCYKPLTATSKENNRFSDFFTPHDDNNWRDSGFTAHFYAGSLNNQGNRIIFVPTPAPDDTFTQLYSKVARWQPVYARRPVKESIYLGLQTLGTLSDDLAASRHAKYVSHVFGPAHLKQKILDSMCRVLEAHYSDLMVCTTQKGYTFYKFTKNGISYTEHTMGAGEKRVFEVLKAAHDPSIMPNGLLLIDELDVLLHEKAFKKLVTELIEIADESLLEIVFSTHRESIVQFKRAINIVSIFNMGTGIRAFPGVSADALRQLTDVQPEMVSVFVEDELARTAINVLLEREALTDKVNVELFGAAENSAVVLAGLMLAGKDIKKVMCVLDGDVHRTVPERHKIVNKCLTGTDKREQRRAVMTRIFEFSLAAFPQKGAPEYNHKRWFEAIDPATISAEESAEYIKLRGFSMSINGLADWHEYYERLNLFARKSNIEHTVLSYISKYSPEWDNYISAVRQEIIVRAAELE
ncbi:TPA: ATP-binding protein [Enterobacter cloacae]|uniref:AAA family ATPase n=1 Tax=Enterobacter cloacae complex TaxID=354276 RepID=UPI00079C86B6|nr:AAA family ATPase [Enterobacter hormaechei]ELC2810689.1 AAA family ATPase [Salmonella enterica]HAS1051794.1 ATP-binding protein [Enterobacter cloacae]EKZ1677944.1 AAA family ATPase [Enterobacter hormaechei]SAI52830.1 Predicted ATP-binding protein involved in virulence [Enterobacter hormaechei]HAS1084258.1 ATP-binding protein [Enterobacter cloacae]